VNNVQLTRVYDAHRDAAPETINVAMLH